MSEWKEKQKGIISLKEWVLSNKEEAQKVLEALTIWIKSKLKDFKEHNPGILKESLILLQSISDTCVTTKKFAYIIIPLMMEKMNEVKLLETTKNIIMSIADSATPMYVATLILNHIQDSKSINTIKGVFCLLVALSHIPRKLSLGRHTLTLCMSHGVESRV